MKFIRETTLQLQANKRRRGRNYSNINMRQTHGKGNKVAKRRLVKEMKWERKKWKTNVSAPRRPSMRSLGARGGSSVQDSVDYIAHADRDENVFSSFSTMNSLASLSNFQYGRRDYVEAEELLSSHEMSQPEGGLSADYEASGITREPLFQINTGSRGSIMGQELDAETVHSADTEIAPSAQVVITDSGLGTFSMAVENVEDSLHVEVAQHSRDEALDVPRTALNHEDQAEVIREIQAEISHRRQAPLSHGAQAPLSHGEQAELNHWAQAPLIHGAQAELNHGAQAVPNQGQVTMQQEVAEVDDISIGNPPRTDDVDIHNDGLHLRYQHHPLTWDVDLIAERHYNLLLRLSYRSLHKCATCFQRPRQTLNLPCRCLCNCLDCDLVMFKCSMCQRPIRASVICGLRG